MNNWTPPERNVGLRGAAKRAARFVRYIVGGCVVLLVCTLSYAADVPSAADVLARLKAGNERFASDASSTPPIDSARRAVLAKGQSPFATVFSCADSRVPPEIIFNTGLGDLFVVRAAGEVVDRSVLASIEYALEHVHTPVLVVMGHEFCGAVTAAVTTTTSLGPNLDFLVKAIQPAVLRTANAPEAERLKAAIMANVEVSINDALAQSEIIRDMVGAGTVTIFGAYYELQSGQVTFSQPIGARAVGHAVGAESHRAIPSPSHNLAAPSALGRSSRIETSDR